MKLICASLYTSHPRRPELPSSGCCKPNGCECEHGLRLALMADQVCLMSHCCDYQHGALAQLEAPQVNHRGAASLRAAGGPQAMLMGFHLLLGHCTFWQVSARDAHGVEKGASVGACQSAVACHTLYFRPNSPWVKICLLHISTSLFFCLFFCISV